MNQNNMTHGFFMFLNTVYRNLSCFCRYLYTDEVDITSDNVMPLLYLARKYLIQTLTSKCQQFIIDAHLMEPENAVEIYHQAYIFDLKDLMVDSMKIINQSTRKCLESEPFLLLPRECVRNIIADNHHQVSEETIYRNVMTWCEEECKRKGLPESDEVFRELLGDILYEIRFPNIDVRFFSSTIEKGNILTADEKQELKTLSVLKGVNRDFYKGKFKCRPRKTWQRVMRMPEGDRHIDEMIMLDQDEHVITFKTSVDCLMHGIVTYGLSQSESEIHIFVELRDENGETVANEDISVLTEPDIKLYDVRFQKAVDIKAGHRYQIIMKLDELNWLWKGLSGRHLVTVRDGFQVEFEGGDGDENTNMLEGQIPGLLLS